MVRICLVLAGLYMNLLSAFSQSADSAAYKSRKLKLDEVNFVSSYYHQDGNNSAVTGGIGTEKLTDYSNNFELNLVKYNKHKQKIDIDVNLGVDYYTSASSDKIDPSTISSASSRDLRIYPSISRKVSDGKENSSTITSISYSHESDYQSYGFGAGFSKKSKDNNIEFTAKGQVYLDRVRIILPIELRTPATGGLYGYGNLHDYPWTPRNTYSTSFSLLQVLNQRLQLMLLLDLTYQHGFLGLPFHRVYLNNNVLRAESLPASRFKIPLGIRANYFLGDRIVIRTLYRFYKDDWGLNAHTADLEAAFKITPFFSFIPFYRYYTQTAIDFFAAYRQHTSYEKYYSSNYDLSKFQSEFFGAGFRYAPPKGLFGKKHWNMIETRYGHYKRTDGLHADIVSLSLKYR